MSVKSNHATSLVLVCGTQLKLLYDKMKLQNYGIGQNRPPVKR